MSFVNGRGLIVFQPTVLGFALRRVFGTQSCQPALNLKKNHKVTSLHVTPPDAKPVLGVGFTFSVSF